METHFAPQLAQGGHRTPPAAVQRSRKNRKSWRSSFRAWVRGLSICRVESILQVITQTLQLLLWTGLASHEHLVTWFSPTSNYLHLHFMCLRAAYLLCSSATSTVTWAWMKLIYCALSVSGTSSLSACITMGLPGGGHAGGAVVSNEAYGHQLAEQSWLYLGEAKSQGNCAQSDPCCC